VCAPWLVSTHVEGVCVEVGVAVMGASWPVLSGRTNSALLQRPAGPEGEVCVCVRVYVCVCVCVL